MPTPWTTRTEPSTEWGERRGYLQQENEYYILLENGFKILISAVGRTDWDGRDKPTTNWTERTEP